MTKPKKSKIILDLCGGTGSWSKPYLEAGYTVYNITLPHYNLLATRIVENDVKFQARCFHFRKNTNDNHHLTVPIKSVYGILAAPPCTMFSFARTNAKTPRDLRRGMSLVIKCLQIIWECQYHLDKDTQKYSPLKFWALENPYFGMLRWFLGKPAFVFDPWEFGDKYKKRTALWGHFNLPRRKFDKIENVLTKKQIEKHKTNSQPLPKFDQMKSVDIHQEWYGKLSRADRRAITSQGFAKAFFEANP